MACNGRGIFCYVADSAFCVVADAAVSHRLHWPDGVAGRGLPQLVELLDCHLPCGPDHQEVR